MHPREFNVAVHRFLNPSAIPAPRGYSHVVETKGPSRTIYLAGQLGMTADGKFAGGPGDFRAQADFNASKTSRPGSPRSAQHSSTW